MDKLKVFGDRLKRIGIDIQMGGNYPWIYLDTVNGKRVKETFEGNHGFTVAFLTLKGDIRFTDIAEIFKIIRKYKDL